MTAAEVLSLIHANDDTDMSITNSHGLTLSKSLIAPQKIVILNRIISKGKLQDEKLDVWLIGGEPEKGGYKLILRADGRSFGLASTGFPGDRYLILTGWYGTLTAAFLSM